MIRPALALVFVITVSACGAEPQTPPEAPAAATETAPASEAVTGQVSTEPQAEPATDDGKALPGDGAARAN